MLCKGIITVYSENHIQNTNALHRQDVQFLNVQVDGTPCYQCALKG